MVGGVDGWVWDGMGVDGWGRAMGGELGLKGEGRGVVGCRVEEQVWEGGVRVEGGRVVGQVGGGWLSVGGDGCGLGVGEGEGEN